MVDEPFGEIGFYKTYDQLSKSVNDNVMSYKLADKSLNKKNEKQKISGTLKSSESKWN